MVQEQLKVDCVRLGDFAVKRDSKVLQYIGIVAEVMEIEFDKAGVKR